MRAASTLVLLLGAVSTLAPLSIDISLPGLPAIASALHASPGVIQWSISAFIVAFGAAQLVVGPLADRYGRRPVLIAGLAAYAVLGLSCSLVADARFLVGLRFLQGLAACTGIVCARAIVRDVSDDVVAGATRQAYLSSISAAAPILAPLLGAGILIVLGWRWLYGAPAVAGATFVLLAVWLIPETRRASQRRIGAGEAYRRILRAPRTVPLMTVIGGGFLAYFAQISASSFVLVSQMHLSPVLYAVSFALNALMLLAAFLTSGKTVRIVGPARVLGAGAVIVAVAGCTKVLIDGFAPSPVGFVLTMMLFAYGNGLVNSNAIALVLAQARDEIGTASGLMGATMFISGSIGSALAGALPFRASEAVAVVTAVGTLISASGFAVFALRGREATP